MLGLSLIPWRNSAAEMTREENGGSTLARFHSELDRLFEDFFGEPFWALPSARGDVRFAPSWSPALDVTEHDDEIIVRAEMPGIDPRELDISIAGDYLVLSGDKKEEKEEKRENYYMAERRFGSFRRQLRLPAGVDREKIKADYENGILSIRLSKSPTAKPKKIPVAVTKK